jgi:hypothetical protein
MWTSRRIWMACCGVLLVQTLGAHRAQGQTPISRPQTTLSPRISPDVGYIGAGSCSAAGCHGGNGTRPKFALANRSTESFSAYSTWIQKDPHARAYQVLLEEKSLQMHRLLGKGWKLPHQEARCLTCHSTISPHDALSKADADGRETHQENPLLDQQRLADGVSCEACHGPAKAWLIPHTMANWRLLSEQGRAELGFQDLRSDLVQRAQNCAACHVGSAGRDVNHDLIAAGHPRLNFELSAYHANLPAHWSNEQDRQSFRPTPATPETAGTSASIRETKLWLVGQLATSDAALSLLESRATAAAAGRGSWPEFSEYSCYACHHDLQSPSWRQQGSLTGRKPGSYPWGTWTYALAGSLEPRESASPWAKTLAPLNEAMGRPAPIPADVLKWTAATRQGLAQDLSQHKKPDSLSVKQTHELLNRVIEAGQQISGRDWDGAAQTYLATLSLYQGQLEADGKILDLKPATWQSDPVLQALTNLREKLRFPESPSRQETVNSPQTFDTDRIKVIQQELQRIKGLIKH